MSKHELDLLEAATRALEAALTTESTRASCPAHGEKRRVRDDG